MKKIQLVTLKLGLVILGLVIIASLTRCKVAQEKVLTPLLDSYFELQEHNLSGISNEKEIGNERGIGNESDMPGFSVIITKKDSVIFTRNYGFADSENGKSPITETTIFDIASVSKQFTGMAIALLEEKGLIDLNEKITKYLPDLPEVMSDITLYQLVHHTSGIRDWPALFAMKGWQPEGTITLDDIYETLKKQEHLNFAPGTGFLYSNSNYNLLAKIVETVTDTSFESWTLDNLLAPLGMDNTCYMDSNNGLYAPGSSSLTSSTADMSKWLINFYSKMTGGEGVYNRMTQNGSLNDGKPIDYGYGLSLEEMNNRKAWYHDGAWGNYRSATVFFPEENVGVVILSNNGSLTPQKIMNDIAYILFGDDNKTKVSEAREQEINDEFFALCAGKYQQVDDKDCYLTFFKKGDEYFLNMYDKNYKLYAKSDSVYFVKEAEAEFVFHLRDGEVNSHSLEVNGKSYLALRVGEEKKEANINYINLTGIFYSSELDVSYEIRYENNKLFIHSPVSAGDIILEHSEDLTFKTNSGLIQSVSFQEENGATISLIINTPRARNIIFKKTAGKA